MHDAGGTRQATARKGVYASSPSSRSLSLFWSKIQPAQVTGTTQPPISSFISDEFPQSKTLQDEYNDIHAAVLYAAGNKGITGMKARRLTIFAMVFLITNFMCDRTCCCGSVMIGLSESRCRHLRILALHAYAACQTPPACDSKSSGSSK